ncbi:MAG: hypothetical protein ACI87E_000520 [Mariniblastus sp.]|jgi:hypothetical protein
MSVKQITTGQDSFLDIVANLVGILIILVVVVGAQASASLSSAQPKEELIDQSKALEQELSRESDLLTKLEKDNELLENRIVRENQFAASLTDQRHQMLMQLGIVKSEMKKQRAKLESEAAAVNKQTRQTIQKQNEFALEKIRLSQELAAIERESNAVTANAPSSEVIKHFPNPIAKTVFSKEVHFLLADGKLSYVPMEELIVKMKSEWKVKAEKLKRADRTIETVGPVANFRMQYELAVENVRQETKVGPTSRKSVQFKHFKLLPTSVSAGESISDAISSDSEFNAVLGRYQPMETTVSVWVYPDGFEDHNRLKNWLHENSFQMASWPLEYGKQISGGPNGFRTSAQ